MEHILLNKWAWSSKSDLWGKIFHFLCDFLLLKQQNLHKNWCILLLFQPSVMYYQLRKNSNNFWGGMQRSKVKKHHFWWNLPYFIVILVCLVPEYAKKLVSMILFHPLANSGIIYMVKWYVKWSESD